MRVSKGWLKAIRDDPELWKKVYLPLPLRPRSNPSRVKGLMRLLNRARRVSSLAFSGISLNAEQYKQIISALPELRHLHVEDLLPPHMNYYQAGSHTQDWNIQTSLTRLTFHVSPDIPDRTVQALYGRILDSCKDTLKELQLFGVDESVLPLHLPKLKVLRLNMSDVEVPMVCFYSGTLLVAMLTTYHRIIS